MNEDKPKPLVNTPRYTYAELLELDIVDEVLGLTEDA
jgi:hypothetical protein